LSAYKNVDVAGLDGLVVLLDALGLGAVGVEALDASAGKFALQRLDDGFGADAFENNIGGLAVGAAGRRGRAEAAGVALQAVVVAVVGQRDGAVWALSLPAAGLAEDKAGGATAVEEDQGLLAFLQPIVNGL